MVYSKNALVLTNPEGATINDLFTALTEIKHAVRSKFNIDLEEEVNLIGIK
jgi:UDP-N-acetylenolpyruvoylglucosamine reductase